MLVCKTRKTTHSITLCLLKPFIDSNRAYQEYKRENGPSDHRLGEKRLIRHLTSCHNKHTWPYDARRAAAAIHAELMTVLINVILLATVAGITCKQQCIFLFASLSQKILNICAFTSFKSVISRPHQRKLDWQLSLQLQFSFIKFQ